MAIMGNYFESEDEKRMNYLKRKLLQWRDHAKLTTKQIARNRIAKWSINKMRTANARNNWQDLVGKYDMFVNKSYLYQLKTRLRNWLKLRSLAEKIRNRFKIAGRDQFKEGIEFKKILVLMKSLFENWEERNKFLAKRFIIRKWYMQVKKLKQRDDALDRAMKEVDKKILDNTITSFADACEAQKVLKAVPVARAVDFFTQLRKIWGDWDKYRRRIMAIMGNYFESEDEKRKNYLKRKLLQWRDNARNLKKESAKHRKKIQSRNSQR